MKGWRISPLLLCLLCAAPARAKDLGDLKGPCRYKLDLMCGDPPGHGYWIEYKPAYGPYERNALAIRFGAGTKDAPSRVEVLVGNFFQKALFVAAVCSVLL